MNENIIKKIKEVIEDAGFSLYDAFIVREYDNEILRVLLHHSEGVSLDKCEEISRLLSTLLDALDFSDEPYILEVGSKGLLRKISTLDQFSMSLNDDAKITLNDGTKIEGKIVKIIEDKIIIESTDALIELDFPNIKKAKTIFK